MTTRCGRGAPARNSASAALKNAPPIRSSRHLAYHHHHAAPCRNSPRRQCAPGSRAAAQLAAGPGAGAGDGRLRHAVEHARGQEQLVARGGRGDLFDAVHRASLPRGERPPRPLGPARGPAMHPPLHQDRRLHGAASRLKVAFALAHTSATGGHPPLQTLRPAGSGRTSGPVRRTLAVMPTKARRRQFSGVALNWPPSLTPLISPPAIPLSLSRTLLPHRPPPSPPIVPVASQEDC
eukprot:scaffold124149_cov36-Phaeocystis_antarctica.AAC.2